MTDASSTQMNVVYDFTEKPCSYDFLQWLINVEIIRRTHYPMSRGFGVAFREGVRQDGMKRPIEARNKIYLNVMRPALELVNAKEVEFGDENIRCHYLLANTVVWDEQGGKVPSYRVPLAYLEEAKAYLGDRWPVIITLREAEYYKRRNSNIKAWTEFARLCGEDIIFLRDTAQADTPLEGFEICPRASKELLFRAALYAHAKANLFVANGPWSLALHSKVPWLNFGSWRPDIPTYRPGRKEWWDMLGVPVGSQCKWSSPYQRLIWKKDDLQNIIEAWEQVKVASLNRRQRRAVNKEWEYQFDLIRTQTAKYGDALLRVDTIKMYEDKDDEPADMLIACDLLEHLAEPMDAVHEMNRLSRKMMMFCIRPDAIRTESWWRKKLNREVNVVNWVSENGMITAIASSGMKVQGITTQGAMTQDDRWGHVEYSMARFKERIELVPAHDEEAIIACYGPSLATYLPKLRELMANGQRTLVSVSGAHDFLIKEGIIPHFHIECDPRPHKTDNLTLPDKRVKYYIGSSCHPSFFDRLADQDVILWHVSESSHNMKLVDDCGEKVETIVSGGGSVGLRAIPFLHHLGYREMHVFGMDCSFEDEGEKQWAGPHAGKKQDITTADAGGRIFVTSPTLLAYAGHFFDILKRLPDIHATVWGDGLLPHMCRMFWKHPQIIQTEEKVQNAA